MTQGSQPQKPEDRPEGNPNRWQERGGNRPQQPQPQKPRK